MGKSDEQALKEILDESKDYLVDDDDRFDFWFGLASTMFDLGRLTDYVRNKALELLKNGGDIKRWDGNPKEQKKRTAKLYELHEKLMSAQGCRKKISIVKPFVCPCNVNDVFISSTEYRKNILILVYTFCPFDDEILGSCDMLR